MSADNLSGQYISSTFRKILQLSDSGSYITDGTGSIIDIIPVTASYAVTASYVIGGGGGPETDPIFTSKSASLATTGSNTFIGDQTVTGSVIFATTLTPPTPTVGALYFDGSRLYLGV